MAWPPFLSFIQTLHYGCPPMATAWNRSHVITMMIVFCTPFIYLASHLPAVRNTTAAPAPAVALEKLGIFTLTEALILSTSISSASPSLSRHAAQRIIINPLSIPYETIWDCQHDEQVCTYIYFLLICTYGIQERNEDSSWYFIHHHHHHHPRNVAIGRWNSSVEM